MDQNVVDCELAERDPGMCVCKGGPTLDILKDIQRLYEERMELIERAGGSSKLKLQVNVLRSWVGDLVGQNTLLARAVEELENEATTKLIIERRRNTEMVSELRAELAALRRRLARKDSDLRGLVEVLRRLREFDYCSLDGIHFFEVTESDIFGSVEWRQKKLEQGDTGKPRNFKQESTKFKSTRHYKRSPKQICGKVAELKILNESLQKENLAKEREIRQLNKDAQTYEQTIMNLRKEMSLCKFHTPEVCKKDAEVMAGMCCTGTECGELVPVKDFSELLKDETLKYQERIQNMEANLKSSGDSIRALRKVNVSLSEEMQAMRRVCAALDEQCHVATLRAHFKDDIIKEMRRQLKQAKTKLKESSELSSLKSKDYVSGDAECAPSSVSYDSVTIACVRAQPRRKRDVPPRETALRPYDLRATASTSHVSTSTPNVSARPICTCPEHRSPDVSVIERSTSAPILVSDASIADLDHHLKKCSPIKPCLRQDSSSCSLMGSPKSCVRASMNRCVQIQVPANAIGCEALYINKEAQSAGTSTLGQCIKTECPGKREKPRSVCSAGIMTKIEKEVMNRSCGRIVKDSTGTCSLVDSASGTCETGERAEYYYNKLLSTQQILENREETIAVQAGSLAVAEARIATLTERANDLRKELDRKSKEFQTLRKTMETCMADKNDASILTDKQMGHQNDIVNTLQDNLSVIEELYRECFYETAKQEDLIEMLRKSYLDVRLMDRQKAHQIGRLQNVINTQKWSLDRCQDIALEVDNLKMEISNFLHSSTSTNNDSGMWERSEDSFASAPGVQDELQDIVEQLLRLQDILNNECTCGLEEQNKALKQEIEVYDIKIAELSAKICELECTLASKGTEDQKYRAGAEAKEKELESLKEQLSNLEEGSKDRSSTCEALSMQLQSMEAKLQENTTEMLQLQQQNECQANTIKELSDELEKANQLLKDNCKIRSEVSYLTAQVALWRAQLTESEQRVRELEAELTCARTHCEHIEACYREKASSVAELQAQLEEAHARGAALCGEARHAVCAVRHWVRRMRDKHREQENLIKEKEALLVALQQRLEERQSESQRTSTSENTPSCSKCLSSRDERSYCKRDAEERREQCRGPSASEMASCSSDAVPPLRMFKKKPCSNRRCKAWRCDAAVQEPTRREAGADPRFPYCAHHVARALRIRLDRVPRDVSPTPEELALRVEQMAEAFADGHRRWTRPHDTR